MINKSEKTKLWPSVDKLKQVDMANIMQYAREVSICQEAFFLNKYKMLSYIWQAGEKDKCQSIE